MPAWVVTAIALATLALGFAAGRNTHPFWMTRAGIRLRAERRRRAGARRSLPAHRARVLPVPARDARPAPGGSADCLAERARLVASCADLADRLRGRQRGLYGILTRDLAAVGVTVRVVDGEAYDAQQHNPVGTQPTSDPGRDLLVAETVRVGYADHGAVVRAPDVIIYRCMEPSRDS